MGMEYVYAALLLHKAGHKVEEHALGKVLEAAGVKADPAMAKAVAASLEGVNIDHAIKEASAMRAAPVAAAAETQAAGKAEKAAEKDEAAKKEEAKKAEEATAAGLSALFG